jgi:hypothetical protein
MLFIINLIPVITGSTGKFELLVTHMWCWQAATSPTPLLFHLSVRLAISRTYVSFGKHSATLHSMNASQHQGRRKLRTTYFCGGRNCGGKLK